MLFLFFYFLLGRLPEVGQSKESGLLGRRGFKEIRAARACFSQKMNWGEVGTKMM